MPLSQFMLPGESVLYESAGEVNYRRRPHALVITGERLLLHGVTGVFASKEHLIAEPLAGIRHLEYSEEGLLSKRGRLDIHFSDKTVSLTGEPEAIKEVWQSLQGHTLKTPVGAADEEVTLVVPPPPLFDDLKHPPARVEPLPAATPYRRRPALGMPGAFVFGVLCTVALAAVAAVFLSGRLRPSSSPADAGLAAAPSPTPYAPTPAPTPVRVRVFDETFTVEEGAHRAVKFTVMEGVADARVSGGFRVTEGSYIDFYVMSEAQYERFATGGPPDVTSVVYREEQWNARVGERLPAGDYYLVFDNREGRDGAQTVAGEFVLVFDQTATAR